MMNLLKSSAQRPGNLWYDRGNRGIQGMRENFLNKVFLQRCLVMLLFTMLILLSACGGTEVQDSSAQSASAPAASEAPKAGPVRIVIATDMHYLDETLWDD